MMRLLLLLAVALFVVIAVSSIHATLTPRNRPQPIYQTKDPLMPSALRNISYGLLLALVFGVVTGWIGG